MLLNVYAYQLTHWRDELPEVFRINEVIVRVFREQHLPEPAHCHVVWPDGMARLTLPDLAPMRHSDPVPKRARAEIVARLEDILDLWNQSNPMRSLAR